MTKKTVSLLSREKRMDDIFGAKSPDESCKLLKTLSIAKDDKKKIYSALFDYIRTCLIHNNKSKDYTFSDDFYELHQNDIMALPNITPNGLILPKAENIESYNRFFSAVNDAFKNTGIINFVDRVQFPINIRVQTGHNNPDVDSRGRASTKAHSDIWAGDPINSILSFLAIVGDPLKVSGIDFYKVEKFPEELVCLLENYDDGKYIMDGATKLDTSFDDNGWWFSDSYLMHNTTKKQGKGLRISIDFRFIPKMRCDTDFEFLDKNKEEFFIDYEKFSQIGKSIFLHTDEKMHDGYIKRDYISGYPVKLTFKQK